MITTKPKTYEERAEAARKILKENPKMSALEFDKLMAKLKEEADK